LRRPPEPVFEQVQGFRVTFKKAPQPKGSRPVGEKTREKARERILRALRENPTITTVDLSSAVGVSQKAVEWNIKKLKSERLLKRIGPDKGGHWEVAR